MNIVAKETSRAFKQVCEKFIVSQPTRAGYRADVDTGGAPLFR